VSAGNNPKGSIVKNPEVIRIAAKSVTVPLFRVGVAEQSHYGETVLKLANAIQQPRGGAR
jgi:hypothetical protein